MKEEVLTLIKYRLKEADASIEEARVLLREDMSLRAVMNRLYYAMFYAVLALLQEKQLGTSKHMGAIAMLTENLSRAASLIKRCQRPCTGPLNLDKRAITWKR